MLQECIVEKRFNENSEFPCIKNFLECRKYLKKLTESCLITGEG